MIQLKQNSDDVLIMSVQLLAAMDSSTLLLKAMAVIESFPGSQKIPVF
jgi:hypothetical protein